MRARPPAKASPPTRSVEPSVPESGCLRELPVPELIHGLRKDRHDGVLVLEHGKKKKAVEMRDGWPVSVKSNLITECLGHYLVRAGRVSQAVLDDPARNTREALKASRAFPSCKAGREGGTLGAVGLG